MAEFELKLPFSEADMRQLKAGDIIYVTGNVMTLRDMAYGRTIDTLDNKENLPFSLDVAAPMTWEAATWLLGQG